MNISIVGAGAFGTAMAIALTANGPVTLLARDLANVAEMREVRQNKRRLPGISLPDSIHVTHDPSVLAQTDTILIAVPAQKTGAWIARNSHYLSGKRLVICSKGIDLDRLRGPASQLRDLVPDAVPAVLTGPSFAVDIAHKLPTALTLACANRQEGAELQAALSTPALRLYRNTDVVGAEVGGALKNVIAIACGVCIGAGFGESARAALMTRGFAEMRRVGGCLGADPETLTGLSGFGDLVLTCSSDKSRNFRFGKSIGAGEPFDPSITVEGAATAGAVVKLAAQHGLDLPISTVVSDLTSGKTDPATALNDLLSRPLAKE